LQGLRQEKTEPKNQNEPNVKVGEEGFQTHHARTNLFIQVAGNGRAKAALSCVFKMEQAQSAQTIAKVIS